MVRLYFFCWLSWAVSTLAQIQSFHPSGHDEITYSINIPEATAHSGLGSVYFQLNTTRQLRWFALGQGTSMSGANIFVVYTNGENITVSPRLGVAEVLPLYNKDAQVSLLDGSGVHDGVITANVRCDSCIKWDGGSEDVASSSSPWIWAVKYGQPLDSSSVSAGLAQHDDAGVVALDLQKATGGSSANPFSNLSGATAVTAKSEDSESTFHRKRTAHAVLMIIAFVIMFPFFALGLHIFPSSRTVGVHGSLQVFTLTVVIAGFGIGVSMAKIASLTTNSHSIIGIVVVAGLVLFQPLMGLLQHRFFRKTGGKSLFAYLHRWFGRIMIVLGVINAGLGLMLAQGPRGVVIAYSVVAGIIGLAYIVVVIWVGTGRKEHSCLKAWENYRLRTGVA